MAEDLSTNPEKNMEAENAELEQQLTRTKVELSRAEETIRKKEQQIEEMGETIRRKEEKIQEMKQKIQEMQQPQVHHFASQVSGPGLHSATVNQTTHVLVELSDSSGRPCSLQQKVTAELISDSPKTTSFTTHHGENSDIEATSPSEYKVSYRAESRGQHKLHVRVNNREINDSPFTITVYPFPTQLKDPVSIATGLNRPYGIAVNSRGEMIVSECDGHRISIWREGEMIQTYGSHGHSPQQMIEPAGIAVDDEDNIYVSSEHKLQKFCSSGEFKHVGNKGSGDKEFNDPRGVTLYNNRVYVCDRNNDRIQVFDLDLNFVESFISRGKGRCEFNAPFDIQFDGAGNMYIAEYCNKRVQVMDSNGCYLREFGQEILRGPSALHIVDRFVYVSDFNGHCIVVYETSGLFVTKFGKLGHEKGEFGTPYCITSCVNGHIYVCDWANKRVQIF